MLKQILLIATFLISASESMVVASDRAFEQEDIKKTIYTREEFLTFKDYGDFLKKNTTENDIVIFVGRSLFLVHHYWDKSGRLDDRTYFSISFSGRPFQNNATPRAEDDKKKIDDHF